METKQSVGLILIVMGGSFGAFIGDIYIREDAKVVSTPDVSQGVRLANPERLWPGGIVYYK